MLKIYVTGGDQNQWALDTELKLAKEALSRFATLCSHPFNADFYHTVDVNQTIWDLQNHSLSCPIPIVGALNNHPSRLVQLPGFVEGTKNRVELVPQSKIAANDMDRLGLLYPGQASLAADFDSYHPIVENDSSLRNFRREIGLPRDSYVIGLLQRDSDGNDLERIKIQKGADIFVALMLRLRELVGPDTFHVLLAGPRRHWIRRRLKSEGINYTFVGKDIAGDDYPENVLDAETMCMLYNMLDLYVIPTRWEGAPRQLFDVICCEKKILSTPVGIVPEVLAGNCLFFNLEEGAGRIADDIENNSLAQYVVDHVRIVREKHSTEQVGLAWEHIYEKISSKYYPNYPTKRHNVLNKLHWYESCCRSSLWRAGQRWDRFFSTKEKKEFTRIGILTASHTVPWGYMGTLLQLLEEGDFSVCTEFVERCDCVFVLNTDCHAKSLPENIPIFHVIDEELSSRIETLTAEEIKVFEMLQRSARATVMASDNCLADLAAAGRAPINPVVIAPPPLMRCSADSSEEPPESSADIPRVLLVSEHLELDMYPYLELITKSAEEGRIDCSLLGQQRSWPELSVFPVVTPREAETLARSMDVVAVLPSFFNTFSLLRLISCGLPVLYHTKVARISNLVGMAGLSFSEPDEFIDVINTVFRSLKAYKTALCIPYQDEALRSFQILLKQVASN